LWWEISNYIGGKQLGKAFGSVGCWVLSVEWERRGVRGELRSRARWIINHASSLIHHISAYWGEGQNLKSFIIHHISVFWARCKSEIHHQSYMMYLFIGWVKSKFKLTLSVLQLAPRPW